MVTSPLSPLPFPPELMDELAGKMTLPPVAPFLKAARVIFPPAPPAKVDEELILRVDDAPERLILPPGAPELLSGDITGRVAGNIRWCGCLPWQCSRRLPRPEMMFAPAIMLI